MCASPRCWLFCAAALRGNRALRSALFCRTRCIRPRGRVRGCTSFAVGSWCCRRYRRRGCRMLPICGAVLHAVAASRLSCAARLLGRNMVLLRDLGSSICGNARCLLHGLGIAPADGRALRSCCTGHRGVLRAVRLLRPRTSSCGIAGQCGMGTFCRMGSWLFSCRTVWRRCWLYADVRRGRISCHTGSRRGRRNRMFRRWLRACQIRSLHKGTALLRGFALYRLPLCVAAVIRFSCCTDRLIGAARWIFACRFSCRTG